MESKEAKEAKESKESKEAKEAKIDSQDRNQDSPNRIQVIPEEMPGT